MRQVQPLTIEHIFSNESLYSVWRIVRRGIDDQLIVDPLCETAFEAVLEAGIRELAWLVVSDRYRPMSPTIVRSAKGNGLTRPLSFLDISDMLVLKALVDALQPQLHDGFPSCVAFARSQRSAFVEDPDDYESWIQAWLRHQAVVRNFIGRRGCRFVVRSDIANFFPTINHRLLRQMISQSTRCDDSVINLLCYLLEMLTLRPDYGENRETGIPQENYDASRVLAHAFLKFLDDEFRNEIRQRHYARWMDDVIVVTEDIPQARLICARIQETLESKGLFVNSGKTCILSARDFARSLYSGENAFLDDVHERTEGVEGVRRPQRPSFDRRLQRFLDQGERSSGWERVLRRYYTESRRLGSAMLEEYAAKHIEEYPASARNILDYLRGRPFSQRVLNALLRYLKSASNILEDVEILIYEFLLHWCIPNRLSHTIADHAIDHYFSRVGYPRSLTEYARGIMALLVYKYGTPAHLDLLARSLCTTRNLDPWLARYGLYVLAGTDTHRDRAFRAAERYEDRALRRQHAFLVSCLNEPDIHDRLLKRFVKVKRKRLPDYAYLPARSLPIIRLIRQHIRYRPRWDRHLRQQLGALTDAPRNLRDLASIRFIETELTRP